MFSYTYNYPAKQVNARHPLNPLCLNARDDTSYFSCRARNNYNNNDSFYYNTR